MKAVLRALLVSLAVHALVAAGLVAYLEFGVRTETVATLDLSSLELSFAEEESPAAPSAPPAPETPPEPPPPVPDAPPEAPRDLPPPPPSPEAVGLPEPVEEPPRMPAAPVAPARETPRTEPSEPEPARESAAAAPRQAKVDAPPRPKASIRPDYPRLARLRGEQGDVVLEIRVDARGAVDRVEVVSSSGFADLDAAAERAARAARFTPAKADGRPVASTARITLNFRLK